MCFPGHLTLPSPPAPPGAVAVAEFIAESPRLLRLDLRENEIKTGGLMALSLALKVNTSLLRLDLDREPKRETVREGADLWGGGAPGGGALGRHMGGALAGVGGAGHRLPGWDSYLFLNSTRNTDLSDHNYLG